MLDIVAPEDVNAPRPERVVTVSPVTPAPLLLHGREQPGAPCYDVYSYVSCTASCARARARIRQCRLCNCIHRNIRINKDTLHRNGLASEAVENAEVCLFCRSNICLRTGQNRRHRGAADLASWRALGRLGRFASVLTAGAGRKGGFWSRHDWARADSGARYDLGIANRYDRHDRAKSMGYARHDIIFRCPVGGYEAKCLISLKTRFNIMWLLRLRDGLCVPRWRNGLPDVHAGIVMGIPMSRRLDAGTIRIGNPPGGAQAPPVARSAHIPSECGNSLLFCGNSLLVSGFWQED